MQQSPRDPAHITTLKIRLSECLRQQLVFGAAGKPFNRVIVERLEAGSHFSDMGLARVAPPVHRDLYDVAVKALTAQEWRLAEQYRDLSGAIRVLLKVGMMLAPESTLLRPVGPRSAAHRFLEGARDKTRRALDTALKLQQVMADHAPTDADVETEVAPVLDRPSRTTFDLWAERWGHHHAQGNVTLVRYVDDIVAGFEHQGEAKRFLVGPLSPQHAPQTTNELPGESGRPQEERDPGNIVEVKIRLPETLRHRLAAEASRNKRTLTAEIRAQLEFACAVELFKGQIGREMAEIVIAVRRTCCRCGSGGGL